MENGNHFSLDFSNASFSFGEGCAECSRKTEELERLRKDQTANQASFKALKQKIINTDQLLRKFRVKSNECSELEKQITEWVRKYEKSQSEVLVLEAQLRKTLENMEPVKIEKQELEKQVANLEKAKQLVETKLNDTDFVNVQLKMRLANVESEQNSKDEMTLENKKKHSSLETKIKNQGNKINKLLTENKCLKVEVTTHTRKEKRLENRLHRTETKLVKHLDILVQNGLMSEKAKGKVMASVARLDRNMDSDIEDDDEDDDDGSLSDLETDEEDKPVTKKSPESSNKPTDPTTGAEITNQTPATQRTPSSLSTSDTDPRPTNLNETPAVQNKQTPAVQNKTPVVPFIPLKPSRSRSTSSSSPTKRKGRERGGMEIALRQLDQLLKWNMMASQLSPLPLSPISSPSRQNSMVEKSSPQSDFEGGPMSPLDDDDDIDDDIADDNFGDIPETVPAENSVSVMKDCHTGSANVEMLSVAVGNEDHGGTDVGKTNTGAQSNSGLTQDIASLPRPHSGLNRITGEQDTTSLLRPHQHTEKQDAISLSRPQHDTGKQDTISLSMPHRDTGHQDTASLSRPHQHTEKQDAVSLSRPHQDMGKQDTSSLLRPNQDTGNQDTVSLSRPQHDAGKQDATSLPRPQQDTGKQDTTSLPGPHQDTGKQETTSLPRPQQYTEIQDASSLPRPQQNTEKQDTTSLSRPQQDTEKQDASSLPRPHVMMTRRRSRLESSDSEVDASHPTHKTTNTPTHISPRQTKTPLKTTPPSWASDPLRTTDVVGFGDLGSGPSASSMEGMLDDFLYSTPDPPPPSDARPTARTSTSSEKENNEPVTTVPSGGNSVVPGEKIVVEEQRSRDESKASSCVKNAKTLSDRNDSVSSVPVKSVVENGCVGVDSLHNDLNITSDDSDNDDDKSDDDDDSDKSSDSSDESQTNHHGSDQKRTIQNSGSKNTKGSQTRTTRLSSATITSTRSGNKSRDSTTPLRGAQSRNTLPAVQKTHRAPVTSKPSQQSSSDSYDTSDLSFSDSSLPPDSSSRGQGGQGKGRSRDTTKTKKRKRADVQKSNTKSVKLYKESEVNKVGPASRQQNGVDNTGQKTGIQDKNISSLPSHPVTPDNVDEESSRDSLPMSMHRKKVPVISESSSSEDNASDTETKISKPPSSKTKVVSRQRAAKTSATVPKTPAFVDSDSSDSEGGVSARVQSSEDVNCNGKLPKRQDSGKLQQSSNRNASNRNASNRNVSNINYSNVSVSKRSASVCDNPNPLSVAQTKPGVVLSQPPSRSDPHPQHINTVPSLSQHSGVKSSSMTQIAVSSHGHGAASSTTHANGEVLGGQNRVGKSGSGVEINSCTRSQIKSLLNSQTNSLPSSQTNSLPRSQTIPVPNSQLLGKQQKRKLSRKSSSSTPDPDFVPVGTCYFHLDHQYASSVVGPSHTSVHNTVNPPHFSANVSAASQRTSLPIRHVNDVDANNTNLTNVNNVVLENSGVTSTNSKPDNQGQKNQGGAVTDLPQTSRMSQAGESGIRPCTEISVSDIEADCKQRQSLYPPTLVRPEAVILKSPPLPGSRVCDNKNDGQSESGLVTPLINSVRNEADGSCSQVVGTLADVTSPILSPIPSSQPLAFLSTSSDTSHLSPFKRVNVKPTKNGEREGSVCKQLLLGNEPLPFASAVSTTLSSPLVAVSNAVSSHHVSASPASTVTSMGLVASVNTYPVSSLSAQVSSFVSAPTFSSAVPSLVTTLSMPASVPSLSTPVCLVPASVTGSSLTAPVMSVSTSVPLRLVSVAASLPAVVGSSSASECVSVAGTLVSVAPTLASTLTPVSFVSSSASVKRCPVSDTSKVAPVSRPLLTANWKPVPFVSASASAQGSPVSVSDIPKVSSSVACESSTVVCRPDTMSSTITVTSANSLSSNKTVVSTHSLPSNNAATSTHSETATKTMSSMFTPIAFVKASAATQAVPVSLPQSSSSTVAPVAQAAESSTLPLSCSSSALPLPASLLSSSSSLSSSPLPVSSPSLISSVSSSLSSSVSSVSSSLLSIPSVSSSISTMSSGPPLVSSTAENIVKTNVSSHMEGLTSSQVKQPSQDAATSRPSSPGQRVSQEQKDKALAVCDLFCDISPCLTPPPSPPPCLKCSLRPSSPTLPNKPLTGRKRRKQKARMTKKMKLEAAAYAARNNPSQFAECPDNLPCASSGQNRASAASSDVASKTGKLDTEGTELTNLSSCGSIAQQGRKRQARGVVESGGSPVKKKVNTVTFRADLEPRVHEVVSQYFCEKTVPVPSVVCQLQQMASLTDCWPSVVNTAVTLVKSDGKDLQPDILKACSAANISVAAKKALSSRAFLDQVEIRLLHLLLHCMEIDAGCDRGVMMRILWDAIFTTGAGKKPSITQRSALCRLFVCVCGAEGRVEEVRVLAYHLVLMGFEGKVSLLLNIAAAWPRALARASVTDMTGVVVAMEYLIMSNMGSGASSTKLVLCFERLCGWQRATLDGQTVLNQQITALQLATNNGHLAASPRVHELCCCVHLLCAANTSFWVVRNFLERCVRSAMVKWADKGEAGASPQYVTVMLRLIVKVVRPDLPTKSKILSQFFSVLARNILTSPHRHADVDASCIDMLLSLAPFKPQAVFKILSDVYNNTPSSSLPAHLRHTMTTVRNLIQSRRRPLTSTST